MTWWKMLGLFCFIAVAAAYCAVVDRRDRKRHMKHRSSIDTHALLDAIAAVESGNNWAAIGRRGERGRCQFMRSTWHVYTLAPFDDWASVDGSVAWQVEQAHLARILDWLEVEGWDFDPAVIAAAWRFGSAHALQHRRADSSQRVANLYWEAVGL